MSTFDGPSVGGTVACEYDYGKFTGPSLFDAAAAAPMFEAMPGVDVSPAAGAPTRHASSVGGEPASSSSGSGVAQAAGSSWAQRMQPRVGPLDDDDDGSLAAGRVARSRKETVANDKPGAAAGHVLTDSVPRAPGALVIKREPAAVWKQLSKTTERIIIDVSTPSPKKARHTEGATAPGPQPAALDDDADPSAQAAAAPAGPAAIGDDTRLPVPAELAEVTDEGMAAALQEAADLDRMCMLADEDEANMQHSQP